jgi:hypothetical protein
MIAISKTDSTLIVEVKKITGDHTFEATVVTEYNSIWAVGQTCKDFSIDSFYIVHDFRLFLKMRDSVKKTLGL